VHRPRIPDGSEDDRRGRWCLAAESIGVLNRVIRLRLAHLGERKRVRRITPRKMWGEALNDFSEGELHVIRWIGPASYGRWSR
jgi:hypothetical protein